MTIKPSFYRFYGQIIKYYYVKHFLSVVTDSVPDGIAVDASIRRVFYTDFQHKLIAAMDYDGGNHDVIMTSVDNLDQPRAIVLHADARYE